jgi:hypothetical protein
MTREEFELLIESPTSNPTSNPLEALKDEARAEGYQQGYLDALNDIELRLGEFETTERLRKMVLSK